ncbi:hypothetical protein JCM19297_3016 [Nonlabens ulvanivorans]|nr:hypothetical protein JCM19297_3016 [Nonlabens ulvanivorans]
MTNGSLVSESTTVTTCATEDKAVQNMNINSSFFTNRIAVLKSLMM